jgi:hypothetical protein
MSDPRPLFSVSEAPALLAMESDVRSAAEAVARWQDAGLTVRTVRGRKMRTVGRLFDEMAAALQFPHYFGENWPAFDECLADMDWLPATVGIVILVQEAAEVLSDADDVELTVLARLIESARCAYSVPIELGEWWDRPAVPSGASRAGRWLSQSATSWERTSSRSSRTPRQGLRLRFPEPAAHEAAIEYQHRRCR